MAEARASCFHCGEPCPSAPPRVRVDGVEQPVCCAGCQAVAGLILSSGLARYYRFRQATAPRADLDPQAVAADWRACDAQADSWGERLDADRFELLLQADGVRCAACAWLIRNALEPLPGIEQVQVDLASGYCRLTWQPALIPLSRIAQELARLGYRPHLPLAGDEERGRLRERRLALRRLGVAGLGMMQVMMYAVGLYAGATLGISEGARRFLEWTSLLVTIPVVFYSGHVFFSGAAASLRAGRVGMDVPVALAIAVAFTASAWNFLRGSGAVYFDSVVMFIFFLSAARYLQMAARHRNLSAGSALARLLPEWAERLEGEAQRRVPARELRPGDRVRVAAGESFPADGVIALGTTEVNEALLTGESQGLPRGPGEKVVAGSVNLAQPVTVQVSAAGAEATVSLLGRRLLALRGRLDTRLVAAERIAGWFVAAVLLLAVLTAGWWLWQAPERALAATLAVLVVSCPCALSLATPAALSAASRALLRRGILLTRGEALEALAVADVVMFDKTGTLTAGQPVLTDVQLNPLRGEIDRARALAIAAALEAHAAHPLARAFGAPADDCEAQEVRWQPHAGLSGRVGQGRYRLGSRAFAAPGQDDAGIWLSDESGWLARFELRDPLRPGAANALAGLAAQGVRVVIASGDAVGPVAELAARLGVAEWRARLDPEAKLEWLHALRAQGHTLLAVGDGVNDALVLGAADVAVSVQGASDLANSAADLVLTGVSLHALLDARAMARRTARVIRQNLAWAVTYNALAVPLAAAGVLAPWMAALGMSASSLLVVANAARLAREVRPATAAALSRTGEAVT